GRAHGLPVDDRLDGGQRLVLGDAGDHAVKEAAIVGGIVLAKGHRSKAPVRLSGLDQEQKSGKMRGGCSEVSIGPPPHIISVSKLGGLSSRMPSSSPAPLMVRARRPSGCVRATKNFRPALRAVRATR